MRVYFQKQCTFQPVNAKESVAIMKLAQEILGVVRWEFSKKTLVSEKTLISDSSIDEEKEKQIFQNFSKKVEEHFPTVNLIKLQFYSIHEAPTSCFVMEKKVKREKIAKLVLSASIDEPISQVDDESGNI
jgi:hypothetical protein